MIDSTALVAALAQTDWWVCPGIRAALQRVRSDTAFVTAISRRNSRSEGREATGGPRRRRGERAERLAGAGQACPRSASHRGHEPPRVMLVDARPTCSSFGSLRADLAAECLRRVRLWPVLVLLTKLNGESLRLDMRVALQHG